MTYCYEVRGTGEVVELQMTIAEMAARQKPDGSIVLDDGQVADRRMDAEIVAVHTEALDTGDPGFEKPKEHKGRSWPLLSDAAGVHPSEVQQAHRDSVRRGVPTRFTPDGRAIFRSPKHRRKFLKTVGMHDKASFL